ncbi:MAG: energy transducer TonB [Lewinella sp.]|nr:energy transducer TonB [Lewinella sp.]
MLDNLSFSSGQVLTLVASLIIGIFALIYGWRYYLRSRSIEALAAHHANDGRGMVLEGRNKYPEVNIFRYSPILLRFGLIAALLVAILAINWTQFEKEVYIPEGAMDFNEDIVMEEPPRTAEPPPPPPPPPPVIEEVPDEVMLTQEPVEFTDQSATMDMAVSDAPVAAPVKNVAPPPPPPPPPPAPEVAEIFKVVEEMPRFPGCEDLGSKEEKAACAQERMLEFIYANIEYPNFARENNVSGTVVVRFVVDREGRVDQIEVLRDIGAGCGEEAVRVVKMMNNLPERWTPGKQRGVPVNVYFTLPVKFVLKVNP